MKDNEVEIKMPFFIPIILIIIIGVVIAQKDIFSTKAEVTSGEHREEMVQGQSEADGEDASGNLGNSEDSGTGDEESELKSLTYTAQDGKKYDIIATLNIPTLGIKYPVLSSTSEELLKVALNKYWGPNPNEVGNFVILGHNYENSKFFSKLHNIKIGDVVQITDLDGKTLDYTVYETDTIDPDNNDCTSQLTNGHTEITLITCRNKAIQRFVVKARAN